MEFGFEVREEEGRRGVEYACYRDGKPCIKGLWETRAFKSQKSAQNWIDKQISILKADSLISDEDRAAIRKEREDNEVAEKAARDAAFDERLRREREEKEVRRNRAILNSTLKARGYKWMNVGFRSEEDADAFDPNLPVGDDWQLVSPDGKVVSVQEALGK